MSTDGVRRGVGGVDVCAAPGVGVLPWEGRRGQDEAGVVASEAGRRALWHDLQRFGQGSSVGQ